MLYEYDKKIYIKPFSKKLVEVEIKKRAKEYDVVPSRRTIDITEEINKKMVEISIEEAYKKMNRFNKETLDIM